MKSWNVFVFVRRCLAAALTLMAAETARGSNQIWTGGSAANGNWSTGGNWSGSSAPGSTSLLTSGDVATFNAAISNGWGSSASNPVIVDANRNIKGITFNAGVATVGNFFVGAVDGNALHLTTNGTLQISNGTATNPTETVNAPLVIEGANGTYTFANTRADAAASLLLGGQISGGSAGNTVITFSSVAAPVMNYVSGNIVNGVSTLSVKQTAGNWTFSGANTYGGGTTLAGGLLRAKNGVSLPTAGNFTVTNSVYQEMGLNFSRSLGTGSNQVQLTGGTAGFSAYTNPVTFSLGNPGETLVWGSDTFKPATLVLNDATAAANLTLANGIDLNNASRTLNVNAYKVTISCDITNSGTAGSTFTKAGVGTLALLGNNAFNSNLTVSAGALEWSGNSTLQALAIMAGATVTQTAGTVVVNGQYLTTGSKTGMYFIGGGSLTMNNSANYLRGLQLEASGNAAVTVFSPAGLPRLATDAVSGQLTLRDNANVTFAQTLRLMSPSVSATGIVSLVGGTLTVPGFDSQQVNPTNAVVVNFDGGTLRFSAAYTVLAYTNCTYSVKEGGALLDTTNNAVTINQPFVTGVAGMDGGLTKLGAGRLTLASTNTYSGATVISAGTLKLGAALSVSNSALIAVASGATCDVTSVTGFTVFPSQTLAGSGTVAGNVILLGTLAPGGTNAVGALRAAANLSLQGGAVLNCNYTSSTADVVNVTGTLTLPANATVYLSGTDAIPARLVLLRATATPSGTTDLSGWTVTGPGRRGNSRVTVSGTEVVLVTSRGTLIQVQ